MPRAASRPRRADAAAGRVSRAPDPRPPGAPPPGPRAPPRPSRRASRHRAARRRSRARRHHRRAVSTWTSSLSALWDSGHPTNPSSHRRGSRPSVAIFPRDGRPITTGARVTNVLGIHHVSTIAGEPQRNVDFFAGLLGLRLVKRTVNFDDPQTYHLYYGDEVGTPGCIMTFFPWP